MIQPERPWWATAVVYQLYVRSFADANGDGIGDLRGIRERLDHLAALGVEAIWLNPCYPSPQVDHGYDVADYFDIEPAYGDLAEFDALIADARARGIKILMDVVPNHCSDQHEWFRAAVAAGPGAPERERFWFRDGRGENGDEPPNNWTAIFGGPAWARVTEPDGRPGQWYLCVFTPAQPDMNWSHPDVVAHFDEMLRFWFDRGVEGFRADAVAVVGKTPGLPDWDRPAGTLPEIGAINPHFNHRPEGHAAWRHWRETIDRYESDHPGRSIVTVAEAYTPNRPDILRQYVNHEEFHQTFAFDLLLAPWIAGHIRRAVEASVSALAPLDLLPTWTLNNHDAQRTPTRYGHADSHLESAYTGDNLLNSTEPVDLEVGERRARAAAVFMLGLPGSAYLYMGEELGLPEVLDLPAEARQDPIFIRTEGREAGRDGCRVPMPWRAEPSGNHGFSPAGAPPSWLPQPDGWGRYAAETQAVDASSTLATYRAAVAARRTSPDLVSDAYELDLVDDPDLVVVRRGDVLVVLNCGPTARTLPDELVGGHRVLVASVHGHVDPSTVPSDATVWLAR